MPPTVPCAASHAMVPAAPDVPAVQVAAVESVPSYPGLHVQVHPPVAAHGAVRGVARDGSRCARLAVHSHEMVLFGGAVLIEHLLEGTKKLVALATLPTFHPAMDVENAVAPSNMSSMW